MNVTAHNRLELRVDGMLTNRCVVLRDGAPLTRTTKLYSPLWTNFTLAGRDWQTRIHVPGGRGLDLLREAAMGGALRRGCFCLRSGDGAEPVATARERGFFDGGYDLSLSGTAAQLLTDRKVTRYEYSGPDGSGHCERLRGEAGLAAVLPAGIAPEQQLFIGLLALRAWARSSSNG